MPVYQSSYRFVAANSIDDGFKTETFVSATNGIVNKILGRNYYLSHLVSTNFEEFREFRGSNPA